MELICRNSLSKVFAVVMAVMCVISCMCMTAFAAETDLPSGATLIENGATINTNDLTSLDTPYVIPADGVESITISGLFGFSSVYGWDGTQWVNLNVSDPTNVTITCADYPEYSYYTMLRGDTMASQTVTVSWVKFSQFRVILDSSVQVVTTMFGGVGSAVISFIESTPIVLLGCILFLMCALVLVLLRFIPGL